MSKKEVKTTTTRVTLPPGVKPKRNRVRKPKKVVTETIIREPTAVRRTRPPPSFGGGYGGETTVAAIDRFYNNRLRKISPLGRDFLKMCLDPMHDCAMDPVGWPDEVAIPSVVRRIPQSFDIAYPIGNTNYPSPGTTWNVHITLNPWLNQMYYNSINRVNNVLTTVVDPGPDIIGGLQAWACPSGVDFVYGNSTGPNPISPIVGSAYLENNYTAGAGRLVSLGMEIINTTPMITVGGTITPWRAPEPIPNPTGFSFVDITTGDVVRSCTATEMRYPPQNEASALLYKSSSQWKANEGCYMIGTFLAQENNPLMVNYTVPYLNSSGSNEDVTNVPGDITSQNTGPIWVPVPVSASLAMPSTMIYPINQMGCIITGLSPSSTFTVKFNCYYETFPSLAQPDILVLARSNTPHDPIALQYLTSVYKAMPVGVASRENFDGEWWANVVEWLGSVAGVTASVFGMPEVGLAINSVAGGGAMALRRGRFG